MERRLKERLIGAAVLVMLVVIFIPMILDDSVHSETEITKTNIPERPTTKFNSQIIPIKEVVPDKPSDDSNTEVIDNEVSQSNVVKPPASEEPINIERPVNDRVDIPSPESVTEKQTSSVVDDVKSRGLVAWVVQLGSFSNQDNADTLVKSLQDKGYPGYVETINNASGLIYRVRVGPELLKSDAEKIQVELKKQLKLEGIIQRYP